MCFLSCGRKVFDYDFERRESVVARPLQCMVGCTSCEVWCVFNAISFPDRNYVKELIKKKDFKEGKREVKRVTRESIKFYNRYSVSSLRRFPSSKPLYVRGLF